MFSTPLVGHSLVLDSLRAALNRGRLGHAFLFVGESGIGKRRAAQHVAQGLLCSERSPIDLNPCGHCAECVQVAADNHPDFRQAAKPEDKHELPILTIQELCAWLALKSARSGRKVAIVDDADLMNDEAANCFLKTLEEPPAGTLLILLASSAETQLATIVSRCQVIRFGELSTDDAANVLLLLEAVDNAAEAKKLAQWGGGSVGRSLLLAQADWLAVRRTLQEKLSTDSLPAVALTDELQKFIEEAGKEAPAKRARAKHVIRLAADFYRDVLRYQIDPADCHDDDARPFLDRVARRLDADILIDLIDRCLAADYHIGRFLHQSLAVDCWLDDLAQISAGLYVPQVGAMY